jgi:LPS sulfotransferase NodH
MGKLSVYSYQVIMNPILITTPRTGSNLATTLLYSIANQCWGYKNNLYEYFHVSDYYRNVYKNNGTKVYIDSYERNIGKWCHDPRAERLQRLQLLNGDYKYMIKLMPKDLEPEIIDVMAKHYDVVFLERRNKLEQLISYFTLASVGKSHYNNDDPKVERITYLPSTVERFIKTVQYYDEVKSRFNGVTIYYEDIINGGSDEQCMLNLLNIQCSVRSRIIPTIPTPYAVDDRESLFTNLSEWQRDRAHIMSLLSTLC